MNLAGGSETNIKVAVKVRPLSEKEKLGGEFEVVRIDQNEISIYDPIDVGFQNQNKQMLDVLHRSREQKFAYDHIFTSEPHATVYEHTTSKLIEVLFAGYNGCVFAYGATGTGKTFSMLGGGQTPGLIRLAIKDIFDRMANLDQETATISVSYVEIYNEQIRDLLIPGQSGVYLDLREDPVKGTIVCGVSEHPIDSIDGIMNLLLAGNQRRVTEATGSNVTSSRSHAIFQVSLTIGRNDTPQERLVGKLSLIDLAGSERGSATENRGLRLREGAKINKSLLALANCINALADKTKKLSFIPFRDSKLTRILKDSLGGNSQTVMLVTISPASSQFEETVNTLKYANRAKNISTRPVENKKLVEFHMEEYKAVIEELRADIRQLHSQLSKDNGGESSFCADCRERRKTEEEECTLLTQQLTSNLVNRIASQKALMRAEEIKLDETMAEDPSFIFNYPHSLRYWPQEVNLNIPSAMELMKDLIELGSIEQVSSEELKDSEEHLNRLKLNDDEILRLLSISDMIEQTDLRNQLLLIAQNRIIEMQTLRLQHELAQQEKVNMFVIEQSRKLKGIQEDKSYEMRRSSAMTLSANVPRKTSLRKVEVRGLSKEKSFDRRSSRNSKSSNNPRPAFI